MEKMIKNKIFIFLFFINLNVYYQATCPIYLSILVKTL